MGECTYYLKARFNNVEKMEEAKPKIQAFFEEVNQAENFWQSKRFDKSPNHEEKFWEEFKIQFPLVTKYLGEKVGGNNNNALSGELCFGSEEGRFGNTDSTLFYSEYTWHLASWDRLCKFLKSEFGAAWSDWISEEEVNPFDCIKE